MNTTTVSVYRYSTGEYLGQGIVTTLRALEYLEHLNRRQSGAVVLQEWISPDGRIEIKSEPTAVVYFEL